MARIRELRKKNKIGVEALAEKLSISVPYLYDLENGRRRLYEELITKLCKIFNVSANELLSDNINISDPEELKQPKIDDFLKAKDLGESLKQVADISYKLSLSKEEQYKLWEKAIEKYGLPKIDTSVNDEEAAHLDKDIPGTGAFKEKGSKKND